MVQPWEGDRDDLDEPVTAEKPRRVRLRPEESCGSGKGSEVRRMKAVHDCSPWGSPARCTSYGSKKSGSSDDLTPPTTGPFSTVVLEIPQRFVFICIIKLESVAPGKDTSCEKDPFGSNAKGL